MVCSCSAADSVAVFVLAFVYVVVGSINYTQGREYLAAILIMLYAGALIVLFAFVVLLAIEGRAHGGQAVITPSVSIVSYAASSHLSPKYFVGGRVVYGNGVLRSSV